MKKSINVIKKGRGRPATGQGTLVGVRLQPDDLSELDDWISEQDEPFTRPEAIRRLVEMGLKAQTPASPVSKPGRRLRARDLATTAIEKIIDPAAAPEEQAQRRRRLTKGPAEFREVRVDQPTAKGK
jgi:hypothetical protein